MSRKLEDLAPVLQPLAAEFLDRCKVAGLKVKFTHTRRTWAEQDALWEQGRSTPGPPCHHKGEPHPRSIGSCALHPWGRTVTNAKGGYSAHNYGLAFDIAEADATPYDVGLPGAGKEDDDFWASVGDIGEALGLRWGGRWTQFPDRPHFEYLGGKTLAQLRTEHNREGGLA